MTRQKVQDQQVSFAGGYNPVGDPSFLRPDQCSQLANFRLTRVGAAQKRLGTQLIKNPPWCINASANDTYGGFFFPGDQKIYISAGNNSSTAQHLWQTSYPNPFAAIVTDLGVFPQYRMVAFRNTNGRSTIYAAGDISNVVYTYNATDGIVALGGSTAKCAGLVVYNRRLWGWYGGTAATNLLYYSPQDNGDYLGDTANSGGSIKVDTFGLSTIVACVVVGASLLILHQQGVSRLTGWGQDDISVQPQSLSSAYGMGRATASGVCVWNDTAYFVSDAGLIRATEASVEPLDTPDTPDPLRALFQAGTSDPSQCTLVYNAPYNEVWVSIKNYGILVYNTVLKAWSLFTGTYASSTIVTKALFPVWEGLGTAPVGTAYGNMKIWRVTYDNTGPGMNVSECDRVGTYKDDMSAGTPSGGTTVTGTIQCHRMFGQGDRSVAKAWRWVNVVATLDSAGTAPVMTSTTQLGSSNVQTFSTLTSVQQPYYCQGSGVGPWIDVVIADTSATASQYEHVDVDGFILGQR